MGAWVFRRDTRAPARASSSASTRCFRRSPDKRRARAGELSGGQGRMLSVAREMMTEPQLLLVDEPTAGLAPNLVEQVYDILLTAQEGDRDRDPAGRAERRAGAAARRPPLSPQSRPGEGGRAGPGIRQRARARADSGMSAGLTKRAGRLRRLAARCRRRGRWPACRLRLCRWSTGEFVAARADHRRLLRDPGGELEPAGRLHRPVLARAACLRGDRRLYVGPAGLSPADAAVGQHPGGRPGGGARPAICSAAWCCACARSISRSRPGRSPRPFASFSTAAYEFTRGDLGLSVPSLYGNVRPIAYYYTFLGCRRRCACCSSTSCCVADRLFHARREGRPAARAVARRRYHEGEAVRLRALQRDGRPRRRLYAHYVLTLTPSIVDFSEMAKIVIMVVIGGLGHFVGPVLAAPPVYFAHRPICRPRANGAWSLFAAIVIVLMRSYPAGLAGLVESQLRRWRRRTKR